MATMNTTVLHTHSPTIEKLGVQTNTQSSVFVCGLQGQAQAIVKHLHKMCHTHQQREEVLTYQPELIAMALGDMTAFCVSP